MRHPHYYVAVLGLAGTLLAAVPVAAGESDAAGPRPEVNAAAPTYYRDPGAAVTGEFTAQLGGAVIAVVPTAFQLTDGRVDTPTRQRAILYGDVDGDGQREYVVGCYFPLEGARNELKDVRARIVVFKRVGTRWLRSWTSPGLGYEFAAPRYNIEEVECGLDVAEHLQMPLQLVTLSTGKMAIAYVAWSQSAALGALPGIYVCNGGRWRNVAPQADRFSLRDLNGDGKLEVVAGSRFIGYGSGDDDVPHVFRWDGERYAEASVQFPSFYQWLARRYRERLRFLEETRQAFARDVWERAIQQAESFAATPAAASGGAN